MGVFHLLVDYLRDIQQENTPSTAENKQKGNHVNHAPGSSSLLLVYFVAAAAPLTGLAYVLQRFQHFQRSSVNGHVNESNACERKTFLRFTVCRKPNYIRSQRSAILK